MNKTHHTLKTRYNIPYLLVSLSLLLLSSNPSLRGSGEKTVKVPIYYGNIITLANWHNQLMRNGPTEQQEMSDEYRERRHRVIKELPKNKKTLSITVGQDETEIPVKDVIAKAWEAFQQGLGGKPCTRKNINKYVNIGYEIKDSDEIPDNMLFMLFSRKISGKSCKTYKYNESIQIADIKDINTDGPNKDDILYGVIIDQDDKPSLGYPQEYHLGKAIRQAEGIDNGNDNGNGNGNGNGIKNWGYIAAIVIIVSAIAYAFYHLSNISNEKEVRKEASQNQLEESKKKLEGSEKQQQKNLKKQSKKPR